MGGANPKDSLGSCADMSNSSAKVPADAIGGAHDLARRGLFEELTALIDEKPESVHAVDDFGATPLYHSCYDGHLHIAAELLRRGADPNLVTQWKLSTSLHRACQGGHRSLVKLLLNSYADANKKDPLV
jgi:ankyrin repeat protein